MPAAHLPKLGDLCLQRQPLGPVLHCIQVNRPLVGCVAEDVVGCLCRRAALLEAEDEVCGRRETVCE